MKSKFIFILLIIPLLITAQKYVTVNVQNNINNNNFGLSTIANEIQAFRNSFENKKKREENVAKALAQLNIIKTEYNNAQHYPENIIDGWHIVIVTDNYNYCSPAKVFVQNNEIKEFVIGDWVRNKISFKSLSTIKKAKALINLNGNSETVEIYFINDLEKPTLTEKPLESAFICFWSDKKGKSTKVWLDKNYFGEINKNFDFEPNCFDEGTVTFEVKPGIYNFKAAGRGSISWQDNIDAKEGKCLKYILTKENKK